MLDPEGQLEGLNDPLIVPHAESEVVMEGQEVPEIDTLALCEMVSDTVEQMVGDTVPDGVVEDEGQAEVVTESVPVLDTLTLAEGL